MALDERGVAPALHLLRREETRRYRLQSPNPDLDMSALWSLVRPYLPARQVVTLDDASDAGVGVTEDSFEALVDAARETQYPQLRGM